MCHIVKSKAVVLLRGGGDVGVGLLQVPQEQSEQKMVQRNAHE